MLFGVFAIGCTALYDVSKLSSGGPDADGGSPADASPATAEPSDSAHADRASRDATSARTADASADPTAATREDGGDAEPAAPRSAPIKALAVGFAHACAITRAQGAVRCWGWNKNGQIGDGTRIDRLVPVAVPGLESAVTVISAGAGHTCAIRNGAVLCWGSNSFGELGDATLTEHYQPQLVPGRTVGMLGVAAGGAHTCAITPGQGLECWGANESGQLGDTSLVAQQTPVPVFGLSGGMISIATGDNHTCAVTLYGTVWCWGKNASGQLGLGSTAKRKYPANIHFDDNVLAVAAGGDHTCAITGSIRDGGDGGELWCWGRNDHGQVGDGTKVDRSSPVKIAGLVDISAVGLGIDHTCAVHRTGAVTCWGRNDAGGLGDGTLTEQPTAGASSVGLPFVAVSVVDGVDMSCALGQNGEVGCWGLNIFGALGNGTTLNTSGPSLVGGL